MKVVIASDSFKGTLSSVRAGEAIRAGVLRVWPAATVVVVPMADGGEGTVDTLLANTFGVRQEVDVRGPLGQLVRAEFGMLNDDHTAIIEMASSSGLPLVTPPQRDPVRTSTYGTGQQILAALDAGARRLLIGVGGSATVDGGCGCAQALGVRFITADGTELPIPASGGDLDRIARIDLTHLDARLASAEVTVLCDVTNPLCGPLGAARVFGPQKGAGPADVAMLDHNLVHLANVIEADLRVKVGELGGAGAAGGLGAGLVAFAGATLTNGADYVIEATRLADHVRGTDLVVTGEGRIDAQSTMGKVLSGVARCARDADVPVIAIAGSAGDGAEQCKVIVDAYFTIEETASQDFRSTDDPSVDLELGTARHLIGWSRGR